MWVQGWNIEKDPAGDADGTTAGAGEPLETLTTTVSPVITFPAIGSLSASSIAFCGKPLKTERGRQL